VNGIWESRFAAGCCDNSDAGNDDNRLPGRSPGNPLCTSASQEYLFYLHLLPGLRNRRFEAAVASTGVSSSLTLPALFSSFAARRNPFGPAPQCSAFSRVV